MDKGEQLAWVCAAKRAVTRCLSLPAIGSAWKRAGVGTTLHERLSSAGANAWADAVASERPAFVRYTANQPNSGKLRIISVFENSTCYKTHSSASGAPGKLAACHFHGLLCERMYPNYAMFCQQTGFGDGKFTVAFSISSGKR